jgi:hypothetical protein
LGLAEDFSDADPIKDTRVLFSIARNKYRLIVQISFARQWVFIKSSEPTQPLSIWQSWCEQHLPILNRKPDWNHEVGKDGNYCLGILGNTCKTFWDFWSRCWQCRRDGSSVVGYLNW